MCNYFLDFRSINILTYTLGSGFFCLGHRYLLKMEAGMSRLRSYSDDLYEEAGKMMEEEENPITLPKYSHLLNDEVATIITSVLDENPLPFPLQDFQKLALHALGSKNNVILVREGFQKYWPMR